MNRIIIDIETVGFLWSEFSAEERAYFASRARGESDAERLTAAQDRLALSPWTGQIVAIGMYNPDTQYGGIFFRAPPDRPSSSESAFMMDVDRIQTALAESTGGRIRAVIGFPDEAAMLALFWKQIAKYAQIITYNGRSFDGPMLMLRSFLLDLSVSRDLVPNRYHNAHIDLCDRLSCFGVFDRYAPQLDIVCRRLGIPSPKQTMSGGDVEKHWRAGEYGKICEYLSGDLLAEAAVFVRYIDVFGGVLELAPIAPRDPSGGTPSVSPTNPDPAVASSGASDGSLSSQ